MGKQSRLKLHELLSLTLKSQNVYFQPPESAKLKYPCIIYGISNGDTLYADNNPYNFKIRYQLTLISRDPDERARDDIAMLPMCRYDRSFKINDLNHDVFQIYF